MAAVGIKLGVLVLPQGGEFGQHLPSHGFCFAHFCVWHTLQNRYAAVRILPDKPFRFVQLLRKPHIHILCAGRQYGRQTDCYGNYEPVCLL